LTDFAPLDSPYRDVFPLRVTPKTDLVVKVDAMSINVPVAQCPESATVNGAYQHIGVVLDNGYLLELTVPNQQFHVLDNYNPVFIRLGEETRVNLYETLQARGVAVAQPPAVKLVTVVQQFLPPCEPTTVEQSQLMRVDYLRFIEQP
jgi:hypothetical protein